jgi:hypothetical protein
MKEERSMNELDQVRALLDQVPEPDPARLAAGRERLLASIADSSRASRARHRAKRTRQVRRLALTGAFSAVVAAVGFALVGGRQSPQGGPSARITLAAQVLRAAALSDASQPSNRPSPHQWIFSNAVERDIGQPVQGGEEWTRFDGRQDAYLQGGQLVVHSRVISNTAGSAIERYVENTTPMSAYDALASLPSSPKALLNTVDATVARYPGSVAPPGSSPSSHHQTRGQLEFQFLTTLLWNASQAAPRRAEADVFRAIATIRGVSAQRGITDAVGRPAIGLSDSGDTQQLLLDPRTYQVTGLRTLSDGAWPVNVMKAGRGPTYPKGTVITSLAWLRIDFVSRPGQR